MAKKKKEKKTEEKEEKPVKKSIKEEENKQLGWFFFIVVVIFAAVLVPYFLVEGSKSFEYSGIDWRIENYEQLVIYHGRFLSLAVPDLNYNIYLREDPRKNKIPIEGNLDSFKNGGVISLTPEVDACRGELSRVMMDLGAFLRQGIGIGYVEAGSTDRKVANESERRYSVCNAVNDRTLVIVDIGEPKIVQDEKNSYCYTIYAEDCQDISAVEKFMVKSVEEFGSQLE